MTGSMQALLDAFDALSEAEQHALVVELLRRAARSAPTELPDEALVAATDELFQKLDAEEAADARP